MIKKNRLIYSYIFYLLIFVSIDSNAEIYPYIGFSLGISASDEDCGDETNPYLYDCEGNATSKKIFGGARLHKNYAIEASYIDMGQMTKSTDISWVTAESKGTNLSLLGILPSDFMELFGKVGLLYWDTSYSGSELVDGSIEDNGIDISLGIGFSFGNDKYAFRFEFERFNKLGNEYSPGGSIITNLSIGGVIYF